MAGRTKRKHQVQNRPAGHAVVNDDVSFVLTGSVTDVAAVAGTLQNRFAHPTEIFLILPFQRVAGCAQAQGKNLGVAAWAVHDPLSEMCYFRALSGFASVRPM